MVIGEFGHCSKPAVQPHPLKANPIRQQGIQGGDHLIQVAGLAHHQTGSAVLYRFGRSPAVSGQLRHSGGGRLQKYDAEPFLLQTPQRWRHIMANTSAQP